MKFSKSIFIAAATFASSAHGQGNVTQTIVEYLSPLVRTDEPSCRAQILTLSQDPTVIRCYPLDIQAQSFGTSPPDFPTLNTWTDQFCTTGCNDAVRAAAAAISDSCRFRDVTDDATGETIDVGIVKSTYRAFAEARFETTCLKGNEGGYCLPSVFENLTAAGVDVMKKDPSTILESAGILCSSDCGQKIIKSLGSVFPIVGSLCDPVPTLPTDGSSTPVSASPTPESSVGPTPAVQSSTPTPLLPQAPPSSPSPVDTTLPAPPPPPEAAPNPPSLTRRSHARAFEI